MIRKIELEGNALLEFISCANERKRKYLNLATTAEKRKGKTRYYKNAAQLKEEHLQKVEYLQTIIEKVTNQLK
jgi:hypothetical protein